MDMSEDYIPRNIFSDPFVAPGNETPVFEAPWGEGPRSLNSEEKSPYEPTVTQKVTGKISVATAVDMGPF